MPDLSDFDMLLCVWRCYLESHPQEDETTRASGYNAGLTVCMNQLAATLERIRDNA
jgi:hypothetical protein